MCTNTESKSLCAAAIPIFTHIFSASSVRHGACTGGERVELGARFGDGRVSKITETEVVLASKGRTEVLKMYPNVDKEGRDKDQLPDTPPALRPRAKARH